MWQEWGVNFIIIKAEWNLFTPTFTREKLRSVPTTWSFQRRSPHIFTSLLYYDLFHTHFQLFSSFLDVFFYIFIMYTDYKYYVLLSFSCFYYNSSCLFLYHQNCILSKTNIFSAIYFHLSFNFQISNHFGVSHFLHN